MSKFVVTNSIGVAVKGPFKTLDEAHVYADEWEDETGEEASVVPASEALNASDFEGVE